MTEHALITGASSGLGEALSERVAARGFHVWVAARRTDALEALAERIRARGGRATPLALDVSDYQATEATLGALYAKHPFELVVANAGVGGDLLPVRKTTVSSAADVMKTNYLGALATLLPAIEPMLQRRRGRLVGVTSLAGEIALPTGADYGTSKAALSFYLESAAMDLAPHGITVTDVRPGFVRTAMTAGHTFDMPFLVELDRAADIIEAGIFRDRRVVRFPLPLGTAITLGKVIPNDWRRRLIQMKKPD